ncbi:hypothetical protein FF021_14920 [Leptospira noguchii]|nr:hypothetical protein FF021_14920 [Leptospira noguchii]
MILYGGCSFDFIKLIFLKNETSSFILGPISNRNDKLKLYEIYVTFCMINNVRANTKVILMLHPVRNV